MPHSDRGHFSDLAKGLLLVAITAAALFVQIKCQPPASTDGQSIRRIERLERIATKNGLDTTDDPPIVVPVPVRKK